MAETAHCMLEVGCSLAALLLLALAAFGIGHKPIYALRITDQRDWLATFVWSSASGLLIVALFLNVLGLAGGLYRGGLIAMTAVAGLWSLGEAAQFYFSCRLSLRSPSDDSSEMPESVPGWLRRPAAILAVVLGAITLATALAPPTGALAQSPALRMSKVFLQQRAIAQPLYTSDADYSLLPEMLYLWGLSFGGAVTAQLIACYLGWLLALATVVLATPLLGRSWAWLAGLVVLLFPPLLARIGMACPEIAASLWLVLGMAALEQAILDDHPLSRQLLVGGMFGAAVASHRCAIVWLAALAVAYVYRASARSEYRRKIAETAGIAALAAIIIALPALVYWAWYVDLRNLVSSLTAALPGFRAATYEGLATGVGQRLDDLRQGFHQLSMKLPVEDAGPIFVAALPGLIFVRRLRGLRLMIAVALADLAGCLFFALDASAILPAIPLLAIAATWTIIEARRMPALPRAIFMAGLGLILSSTIGRAAAALNDTLPVALGLESRQHYLFRREATFTAATIVNRLAGKDAQILSQDERGLYFDGRFVSERSFRRRHAQQNESFSPAQWRNRLKAEGFTHLLLMEPEPGDVQNRAEPANSRGSESGEPDSFSVAPLATYQGVDAAGTTCRYQLILLR